MPRLAAFLVVALATLAASPVRAELRMAYVDMQRSLAEIEEGRIAKAKLKKQFDEKQKMLDERQTELKQDNDRLEAQAREGVLKDDKLREKKAELEKKLMEVTKLWQDSQKQLSEEEHRITQEIFGKMAVVIRGIAESEGFTYVFDKNEAGLLYGPDSMDITNELVRKYNGKYGSAAGAAKPDAAKDKPAPKK